MINIKFTGATSVQLKDQEGNTVQNVGEFISPTQYSYSGNTFSKDPSNFYHFEIEGTGVSLSGIIGDVTEAYQYFNLFTGQSGIVDASKLTLSSATTKQFCYANMFLDCVNLTSPPTISATTLDEWCYSSMFGNCSSLRSAPALVATTLAPFCYYCMFYGCTSLSTSPNLPAETLTSWCYNSMFYNCQNLDQINCNFGSWSGNATSSWVTNVADDGVFQNNNVDFVYSNDKVPDGWEDFNQPLTFKAVGIASNVALTKNGSPGTTTFVYKKNDGDWTAYTVDDIIDLNPNDTVAFSGGYAYDGFSRGIGNFYRFAMTGVIQSYGNTRSLMGGAGIQAWCFYALFSGCASLISAPRLPATYLDTQCYWAMFKDCTNLKTPPKLPAKTVHTSCYNEMFKGCTSLTAAPYLPATNFTNYTELVANFCYKEMFYGCSKLSSINVALTTWTGATNPTENWVAGVAESGTFTKPLNLAATSGTSYIPQNWNVVNK